MSKNNKELKVIVTNPLTKEKAKELTERLIETLKKELSN